jgi:RHS repeat-associated protein
MVSATAPVWRYADATTNMPLASFTYGYNADGQVTSYTGPEGTLNYSYDKDGELTGVSGAAQASYSYDANGNRTMSGYQTGPGNELLNDGQFTYTYDKDGNLLSKRDASGDVWSYSWDYRNRLTEVKETNAQNQVVLDEVFTYDVNNNLIGEAVNGVPQRWTVYDGSTPYLDLTGGGQVSERYLADSNALAMYWARVGVTGQADWMVTDLLGSVRALVSAGGSVEDQIAYDAYGNIVTETNAAAGGRLKYAGGQYDGGLGLTLFGARWYNSAAGRWLSQDPLGLGPDSNPYRYVYDSPTNGTDPTGQYPSSLLLWASLPLPLLAAAQLPHVEPPVGRPSPVEPPEIILPTVEDVPGPRGGPIAYWIRSHVTLTRQQIRQNLQAVSDYFATHPPLHWTPGRGTAIGSRIINGVHFIVYDVQTATGRFFVWIDFQRNHVSEVHSVLRPGIGIGVGGTFGGPRPLPPAPP